VRVFPRRHRSIPLLRLACRPVSGKARVFPRRHRSIRRSVARHLACRPVSESTTYAHPTKLVAPAGLEPARDRPHKEAPSRLRTPSLTERNGTIQLPAVRFPHHRFHGGAKVVRKSPLTPMQYSSDRTPISPALPLGATFLASGFIAHGSSR
jgi:hypothetical protein